jgi:hypothetical protein
MALKKPSNLFGESKKESIVENLVKKPELSSFSDAVNSYKKNISKFEDLSEILKSIENAQSDIKDFVKKEDLDNAALSYTFLLEETVAKLKNDVKGINEKNLISIRSNVSNLTEKINNFFETEIPKYKKNIVEIEIKSSDKFEKYKNDIDIVLEDISKYVSDKYQSISENKDTILEIEKSISKQQKDIEEKYILEIKKSISKHQIDIEQRTEKNIDFVNETVDRVVEDLEKKINLISDNKDTIFEDLSKKITEVKNLKKSVNKDLKVYEDHKNKVENKISDLEIEVIRSKSNLKNQNEEFIKVKKDIGNDFNTIHEEFKTVVNRLNLDELEEKNIQLSKKVKYLEEVFDKFNEKEFLNEGLINITPETDNSDPLTPLDKDYVTLNQLQDHYRIFINRIQQQLSTLGGGGETRLQYLDDIVGVATNLSTYNGYVLKVDTSLDAPYKFKFAEESGGGSTGVGGTWAVDSIGINTTKNVGIGTTARSEYTLYVGTGDTTKTVAYFDGQISVAGSVFSREVVNIDSVGIITGRKDLKIDRNATITGIVTAASFSGSLATTDLTGTITNAQLAGSIANDKLAGSIANNKLANDSVSYGGIEVDLGSSDATPAFNLTDATNYPYTSLTGIATHIVGDTTPQLGGDLDGNSKNIYGVGIITATKIADGSGSVGSASSVLSSTGSGLSWVAQSGGSSSTDMLEVMLFT